MELPFKDKFIKAYTKKFVYSRSLNMLVDITLAKIDNSFTPESSLMNCHGPNSVCAFKGICSINDLSYRCQFGSNNFNLILNEYYITNNDLAEIFNAIIDLGNPTMTFVTKSDISLFSQIYLLKLYEHIRI